MPPPPPRACRASAHLGQPARGVFVHAVDPRRSFQPHGRAQGPARHGALVRAGQGHSQRLEHDREEKFNHALFKELGDLELLGVTTDVEYGESGMDATAACIVHEELSQADPSFCLSYLAHSMLFVNNLNQNGNEDQKARFLPDVCSGAKIGGMGMSEPNNGTDVLGLTTTAEKDGDSYVLNGTKMWITNSYVTNESLGTGETGDVYLVWRTGGPGAKGLSLFLVEKGMEGFSLGQPIKDKCGMRASNTGELVMDNVRVPAANLVGENGATLCMMRNLEIGAWCSERWHGHRTALRRRHGQVLF